MLIDMRSCGTKRNQKTDLMSFTEYTKACTSRCIIEGEHIYTRTSCLIAASFSHGLQPDWTIHHKQRNLSINKTITRKGAKNFRITHIGHRQVWLTDRQNRICIIVRTFPHR